MEALSQSITAGEIVGYKELFARVRKRGTWSDSTINQHLMSTVANLPPAHRHWNRDRILFLRSDGRYERFNPGKHPQTLE